MSSQADHRFGGIVNRQTASTGLAIALLCAQPSDAAPTVSGTSYLGTLTGPGAQLHPDNQAPYLIAYYGTDLGISYGTANNAIQFLFGDSYKPSGASAIASVRT